MSKELNEIEIDLNSQLLQRIYAEITKKMIPHFQNSLGELEHGLIAILDIRSKRLHRSPKATTSRKMLSTQPKIDFPQRNSASYRTDL